MKTIKSMQSPIAFSEEHAVLEALRAYAFVLMIRTDRVEYLRTEDVKDLSRMMELRAHTQDEELHLMKKNGQFFGRIRRDGEGNETEYMDENQCLWGTAKSFDGVYTCLQEDRGISISVPVCIPVGKHGYMMVRNYLDAEKFVFTDYRIVTLGAEGGENNG